MPGSPTTPTLDRVRPLAFGPVWDHRLSGTALRGGVAGTGQARRVAPAFRVFRVLRPANPPCCHQASRCGPAPAPARVRTPRPALFVVGCCPPLVRPDHHYLLLATATAQPAGAFQHCVRAESAGPNGIHCRTTISASRLADRNDARDCPPRTIRTGPPTLCHRPQQLQRLVAQRIQNLTPVIAAEARRRSESPQYRRAGPPAYRADCRQRRQRAGAQRVR